MFNSLLHRVYIVGFARPFLHWWNELRFYWITGEKSLLVFLSIAGLVISTFGFMIYTAISNQMDNKDLTCLALNVYYEARGETKIGRYAVAKVTLNRVASPRYPNTVCEVVYQKNWDRIRRRDVGAFSWTEFDEPPAPLKTKTWQQAWDAAEAVYYNQNIINLDGALFYHARRIKPRWAKRKKPTTRIGKHIFYR